MSCSVAGLRCSPVAERTVTLTPATDSITEFAGEVRTVPDSVRVEEVCPVAREKIASTRKQRMVEVLYIALVTFSEVNASNNF